MNSFIFNNQDCSMYCTNCSKGNNLKYPVLETYKNSGNKTNEVQDVFSFLSTENGYKLISISIKSNHETPNQVCNEES